LLLFRFNLAAAALVGTAG